jgi:hypothetical protein
MQSWYARGMPKLRDGTSVRDRRLARLRKFDPRSRKYSIVDVLGRKKPRNHTWRCGVHLDQGDQSACVAFAVTHALHALKPSLKLTERFAIEQVYWESQRIDPWDGGTYPGAKPKAEGAALLYCMKALRKAGYLSSYRWAFGLDQLILAVSWAGPVIIGISWFSDMFDPCKCGYLHPTGKHRGGHGLLCKGVDIDRGHFLIHNSWGPNWGKNGDAFISFNDMKWLLERDGEAVIPTLAPKPPRPPK